MRELLGKGLEKWLGDILLHTKTIEEHLVLLRKVLLILARRGYTGNFPKSEFCLPEIEFKGEGSARVGNSDQRGRAIHAPHRR